jgi:cytidylate kinase
MSKENSVYLISANTPGCGSTTLAKHLQEYLNLSTSTQTYFLSIGNAVREKLELTDGKEESLSKNLDKAASLEYFVKELYLSIPQDCPVIIEGKKAIVMGQELISKTREIIPISLSAPLLTSVSRVMNREGFSLKHLVMYPETIEKYFQQIQSRVNHIKSLATDYTAPTDAPINSFDTSIYRPEEIVQRIMNQNQIQNSAVPTWEVKSIQSTLEQLYSLSLAVKSHPLDKEHFYHSLHNAEYKLKRLGTNNTVGIDSVREDLHKDLIHAAFSILIKNLPRFVMEENGKIKIDTISRYWTPEYYKIAEAWPTLTSMLKDKTVLDPFAGPGTLLNLLSYRNIPKSICYGDISYIGGKPINGSELRYVPELNTQMVNVVFDALPSYYKHHSKALGYVTSDAKKLPFDSKSFDYILGDPPYGKNLQDGGVIFFVSALDELQRVTKYGGIYLVPCSWLPVLSELSVTYTVLTNDLSSGDSNNPVQYIVINN